MGPEADAENRLAKALWELGELGAAREHYQAALALDPTNRIAERNIDRLKTLLVAAGEKTVPAQEGSKAPVRIFVEETGKTGFAHLLDLPDPKKLAQVNPGDTVELTPEGNRLIAISNGMRIGVVEPRVAARLLKLIADGNKYLAGVTSLGAQDVRIIIREIFQDPATTARCGSRPRPSRPTSGRTRRAPSCARTRSSRRTSRTTSRTRRSPDLESVLPPEDTTDEAFEEETDENEGQQLAPLPLGSLPAPRSPSFLPDAMWCPPLLPPARLGLVARPGRTRRGARLCRLNVRERAIRTMRCNSRTFRQIHGGCRGSSCLACPDGI